MKNPNGPSIEEIDDMNDALLDEQRAMESKAVREAKCTVCGETWVDVMSGEDTCKDCLTKQ